MFLYLFVSVWSLFGHLCFCWSFLIHLNKIIFFFYFSNFGTLVFFIFMVWGRKIIICRKHTGNRPQDHRVGKYYFQFCSNKYFFARLILRVKLKRQLSRKQEFHSCLPFKVACHIYYYVVDIYQEQKIWVSFQTQFTPALSSYVIYVRLYSWKNHYVCFDELNVNNWNHICCPFR